MNSSVFVVEDDRDVLDFYLFLLEAEGFAVWNTAVNGETAIDLYRNAIDDSTDLPDVVMLDHRLPGCTGLDVARAITRMDPEVVIVFVTADDHAIEAARAIGIHRLKRKPCDNDRLIRNLHGAARERGERLATVARS